jgi:penicillin-binding protein 1A
MTTLEMAAAYATFASGGTYTAPYGYTKVLDSEGKLVIEAKPIKYRVYSKETCFMLSDILKGVVTTGWLRHYGGQIKNAKGKQIDTAGKTGTTSDNIDKWFCGYTPYYAAAVWYGYDNRLKQTKIPKQDWYGAGRIWEYAMKAIHKDLPAATFKRPGTVVKASYCSKSGMYPNAECKKDGTIKSDYFVKGSFLMPKEDKPCKVHATPTPGPTKAPTPPPEDQNNG